MGHPVCLYRRAPDGEIESKIFDSESLPTRHWVDDPAKCKAVGKAAPKKTTSKTDKAD